MGATLTYYGTKLTDNISESPEGFLQCLSAVLARTGWQTYQVRDLPQDTAEELGIDISRPLDKINLYRSPEQVFAPETIASFNSKPVCDNHPPTHVDAENARQYIRGHDTNVRKGEAALVSGDWPLIGDLIIT